MSRVRDPSPAHSLDFLSEGTRTDTSAHRSPRRIVRHQRRLVEVVDTVSPFGHRRSHPPYRRPCQQSRGRFSPIRNGVQGEATIQAYKDTGMYDSAPETSLGLQLKLCHAGRRRGAGDGRDQVHHRQYCRPTIGDRIPVIISPTNRCGEVTQADSATEIRCIRPTTTPV